MYKRHTYPVCKKAMSCKGSAFSYFTSHFWRVSIASYSENNLLPGPILLDSIKGWAFGSLNTPISLILISIIGHFPDSATVRYFQFTWKSKKERKNFDKCNFFWIYWFNNWNNIIACYLYLGEFLFIHGEVLKIFKTCTNYKHDKTNLLNARNVINIPIVRLNRPQSL